MNVRPSDPDTSHAAVPKPDRMREFQMRTLLQFADGKPRMAWQIEGRGIPGVMHQRCSDLINKLGYLEWTDENGLTTYGKEAGYIRITQAGLDYLSYLNIRKKWREQKPVRQKSELRSYQNRVCTHLYENPEAFAVLKMGAGKTISALTAIEELIKADEIRHALIIAPKRVATIVWPDEIEGWAHTKGLKYAVLDGPPKDRQLALDHSASRDITIIGIDNVQWLVDQLKDMPDGHPIWDCLVIDETSKLKDPKSKRAKALASVAGKFKNRWGLTGTPTPNSLLDLFNPARVITDGRLWGRSFYQWRKQHFYPTDFNQYNWSVLPGHDDQIRADAASISITLAEGDMPDLPELSILIDEVDLPPFARVTYRQMERKLHAEIWGESILARSQAVATGKLAQIANGFVYDEDGAAGAHAVHGEKQAWIQALVDDLEGEPLIVVYEYKEDLAMLRRIFGDIPYLGAGVPDHVAQQHVKDWNMRKLPIFALHPASGGHGLNLQSGGSRMAWLAPTWSAELWDQTCARLHRPGQAAHVMVHVCVASGTVDELKRLRVISKLSAQQAFEQYLSVASAA